MRTPEARPTHLCSICCGIGRGIGSTARFTDPLSSVQQGCARPRPGRGEAGHARTVAVALLAAILFAVLLSLAKDFDLSILPSLFPHSLAERLRQPGLKPLHIKDADSGSMFREKIHFPAPKLFDSIRGEPVKEMFVSVPDLEAEEVLYLEKALQAAARMDSLADEHEDYSLVPDGSFPDMEAEEVFYLEKALQAAARMDSLADEHEDYSLVPDGSFPDMEAEEVLYLEKALQAAARMDSLADEHDPYGLHSGMFMPEYESSVVPLSLGTITVDRLDTVSVMVQRVYGTARVPYLELVAGANPEIEDLNTVVQGTRLVFPALNPRRIKAPVQGYWLSLGRYSTLEAAYRELSGASRTGTGQWVLLSGFSPADGMYFTLLDPRAHATQAAAQEAADDLSQALGMPVQVVAEWWGQSLFLTDQPSKGLAAAAAPGMHAGLAEPAQPSPLEKPSATEMRPVPDGPPVPDVPVAPDEQPARTVSAAVLSLQTLFGSSVPDSFQTGNPQQIYALLAEGLIRDYALRDPGLHPDSNGGFQAGFIQVVAHVRRDLADEEADSFLEHGWPAAVFSTDIQGRILHRVLVGPFASPQEALDVRALAREASAALDLVKTVMERGRIEALEGPGEAGQIVLAVEEDAPQAARALEALGWPVLEIKRQAVHIGPFPDERIALDYQQSALRGAGWGPRHDLLD